MNHNPGCIPVVLEDKAGRRFDNCRQLDNIAALAADPAGAVQAVGSDLYSLEDLLQARTGMPDEHPARTGALLAVHPARTGAEAPLVVRPACIEQPEYPDEQPHYQWRPVL